MNKDEMINNIATSIGLACTSIELDLKDRQEIAKTLYILGYRKVAEDEIVIKKQAYADFVEKFVEQEEIAHSYEQGYAELLQSNHFLQDKLENAKQETREILQKLKDNIMLADFGCGDGYEEVVDMNTDELKKLAKEKGIELED